MHAAERVPGRLPVLAPTGREVCVCACVRVCVLACVRACVLRAGDSGAPTFMRTIAPLSGFFAPPI